MHLILSKPTLLKLNLVWFCGFDYDIVNNKWSNVVKI